MEINTGFQQKQDITPFIVPVKKLMYINELTYEILHEFIDRILIYETDKSTNARKIEIFYNLTEPSS